MNYEELVAMLADCSASNVKNVLSKLSGSHNDAIALLACVLISSEHHFESRPQWLEEAFQVLEKNKSRYATMFLKQAAASAHNCHVRLRSTRSLRYKDHDEQIAQMLHSYVEAKTQQNQRGFQHEPMRPEDFQLAALEALARQNPHPTSVTFIWEFLLSLVSDRNRNSEIYDRVLDCLSSISINNREHSRESYQLQELALKLLDKQGLRVSETRQSYLRYCKQHGCQVLGNIVREVLNPEARPQLAYLVEPLLCAGDELALAAAQAIVTELDTDDPSALRVCIDRPAYSQVEQWLQRSLGSYLRDALNGKLLVGNRMRYYWVGLCQRLQLDFPIHARKLLRTGIDLPAKLAVIQQVETSGGKEALELLGEAIAYVAATDGEDEASIRMAALRSIANLCDRSRSDRLEPPKECISQIHARLLRDARSVRLGAYEACRRIADFSSIVPLSDRQKTEKDPEGIKLIDKALTTIRERLAQERPPRHQVPQTTVWLQSVIHLESEQLQPLVRSYLIPPHANEDVQLLAIKALVACSGHEALGAQGVHQRHLTE